MTQLGSSSGPIAALQLSFNSLQAWVHRPQAIAKCLISDLYDLQPIYDPVSNHAEGYRDIFLLNQFPCKYVEIVGWVAGVEDKESRLNITIDDGDGLITLPVQYKLPRLGAPVQPSQPSRPIPRGPITASTVFASARERRLKQEAAAKAAAEAALPRRAPVVLYPSKDICVGDVVRVIGRVDEWGRRKHGNVEWIRGVTVEEGAGGSVTVVNPDEAMWHFAQVMQLHETTYCRPFAIPPLAAIPMPNGTPDVSVSYSITSDFETQSEMPSELSMGDDQALPDIRKLRSSQLTENTFRRYLLDYMTEEVRSAALQADVAGIAETDKALSRLFPEYRAYAKYKSRQALTSTQSPNIASFSTPRNFHPKAERTLLEPEIPYPSFTIPSLVATPHLAELAEKIVDAEAKKEERRRRKRILNGEAKEKDLALERSAMENGGKVEWRLTGEKKKRAMERLFSWGLRISSEEGSLVHVSPLESIEGFDPYRTPTTNNGKSETTAYIPLPQPLILPILLRHLEAEQDSRGKIFLPKGDPRKGNGMTIDQLLRRVRGWGEEGRWERLGDHSVEAGIQWGILNGRIKREGIGYWAVNRDYWVG